MNPRILGLGQPRRRGRLPPSRPRLEWLEDRATPSTSVVSSIADAGAGSLRDAIAAAAAGDVITFAPALSGQSITLSSRLVIDKSLTIAGPGANLLTLDGVSTTGLVSIAGGPAVSISGLTLTRGFDHSAGAIDNPAGSLSLSACSFVSNNAGQAAGAIDNGGRLVIEGSSFLGNKTSFGSGGAILNTGDTVISTSVFSGNAASADGLTAVGGAIYNQSGSLSLVGCTFVGNQVVNGSVPPPIGGAVANAGDASVTNCTFTGNKALGAFLFWTSGVQGAAGGAIANQGGNLRVRDSTIYANTANSGRTIATGGGIANLSGTLTLMNTIVAGDTATYSPDLVGAVYSLGYNLIQDASGAGLTGDTASILFGADPRLGPLAYNGGPTPTMALLPDSPAINRGHFTGSPTVDQRGSPRVIGGAMDVGAYESGSTQYSGLTLAVGTASGAAVVNVYDAAGTLRMALAPFPGFLGGVTTAVGDVNGDGIADVIVGAGPGAPGGHVKVFDGQTGAELMSFMAFDGFLGGVTVAAGDVNGDGKADVIVGAGPGAPGGHVKVFDGGTGQVLQSFFAFAGFAGGVTVAGGDVNGDGYSDVIVGAGWGAPGGHVKVFDGRTGAELVSFMAFGGFAGGVTVAAGDVNGDGYSDVIVGAGAGAPGGHVKVFDVRAGTILQSFMAFDGFAGGVSVAAYDADLDGLADVAVGAGPSGMGGHVKTFDGLTLSALDSFFAYAGFAGGVCVGGT
jgi:hypothetical protein